MVLEVVFFRPVRPLLRGPVLDLRTAAVRCSSFEAPSTPELAFDGVHRVFAVRETNRWVSDVFVGDRSEWIAVDLERDMLLSSVAIDWELAFAKDFSLRTRTSAEGFVEDPARWTERGRVMGFRENKHGAVNAVGNQEDVVFDFARRKVRLGAWMGAAKADLDTRPAVARHVMIQATARGPNNPGVYSIHEIEIAAQPAESRR